MSQRSLSTQYHINVAKNPNTAANMPNIPNPCAVFVPPLVVTPVGEVRLFDEEEPDDATVAASEAVDDAEITPLAEES